MSAGFDACACGRGLVTRRYYKLGRVHNVCAECAVEAVEADASLVVDAVPASESEKRKDFHG